MVEQIKVGYTNNHIAMITNNREQIKNKSIIRLKTDKDKQVVFEKLKSMGLSLDKDSIVDKKGNKVAPNNSFIVIDLVEDDGVALYINNNNLFLYNFKIVGKRKKNNKSQQQGKIVKK